MFKRISYRIALQFTAFVFLLLLVNGTVFLVADYGNARRQTQFRLERLTRMPLDSFPLPPGGGPPRGIPMMMRERARIADAEGNILYDGGFFEGIPFMPEEGLAHVTVQGEQYAVMTRAVREDGEVEGYVQFAEIERQQQSELPLRVILFLVVSAAISGLTFGVGLFFARRSLRPAEETMRRLEQFTQDASHELRTPLAALSSSLDLALKTGKHHEGILSAKEDLKEVAVLVERLLELAQLDKFVLQRVPVDLSSVVEDAVAKYRSMAGERSIEIESHVVAGTTVEGDGLLIRQVLGNLLPNAIKFNRPGGQVRVDLTGESLTVADTGIGIGQAALLRIFDRFYQVEASRAKEGFGLGLALAKRIVELHGWTISVRSQVGEGTAFTIVFGR